MNRKVLQNFAVAAVILAGGCAYSGLQDKAVLHQAVLPQPPGPETIVTTERLNGGRQIQADAGIVGKVTQVFLKLVAHHEGHDTGHEVRHVTAGALKAEGLFPNLTLSDDSMVLCLTGSAGYTDRLSADGEIRESNYSGIVAIFDPTTTELISYGLIP